MFKYNVGWVWLTYIAVIAVFFIDVCVYGFFNYPWLNAVLCWYVISLLRGAPIIQQLVMVFCILLEDLLVSNIFGLSILYIIPLVFVSNTIARNFHQTTAVFCYLVVIGAIIMRSSIISWVNNYDCFITTCTIPEICITIIVTFIFLKFYQKVSRAIAFSNKRGKSGLLAK